MDLNELYKEIEKAEIDLNLQIETMRHGSLEERTGIAVERIMVL